MGLRILIVGGGIAGLTAAAALAQRGHAVVLVEKNNELRDAGGVGLTLVGNAMRALAAIGVAEQCVAQGMPADSMVMRRPDGQEMFTNPLPRIGGPQWPGATGIRRSVLHAILVGAVQEAGVEIRCGTTLADWQEDLGTIVARMSNSDEDERFDLLVGADGLYSSLRERLLPGSKPAFTGQSVWRAEAPRPADLVTTEIYLGGRHGVVGTCPVSDDLCYFYIVHADPDRPRRDPATLHVQLAAEVEGYGGRIPELAATVDAPEKVSFRPLDWILAPRPWGQGRAILIGDAVHANPPVLAQGAAMAIEDAVVLAEELSRPDCEPEQALASFVDRRFDRSAAVVRDSCDLARAEVEHSRDLDVAAIMRQSTQRLAQAY